MTGIALATVAILGILVCVQPFTGDQALFAAGARQIQDGDVLYRDFWDVKQPGIYAFYLVGGMLVGYREVALHLFELGVLLAFAAVLASALKPRFTHPWVAGAVPLLILGTYYATAEPLALGQVESLAGIPLFFSLWCAVRSVESTNRARWLFLAGMAGGFVGVFKIVLLPIVGAFWLLALVPTKSGNRSQPTRSTESSASAPASPYRIVRDVAILVAGFALPISAVIAYLAAYGQLELARWTYFDVTPAATGIAGRPWSRLTDGAFTTGARWAVPLALATYGGVRSFRTGWDRFRLGLAAWIALGIPIFLVQHWWIYQYAMFFVPVGIFAGFGLDALADSWRGLGRRRIAVLGLGAVLIVPLGLRIVANTRDVATHGFALNTADRAALRRDAEPNYRAADDWARYLRRSDARAGDVYVLGNPLDLYRSGRRQSVPINGWSPEQYPADVWARLSSQIRTEAPVEIVVDQFSADIMRDRAPRTLRMIDRRYRRIGGSGEAGWYRLRDPKPAATSGVNRRPRGSNRVP